MNGNSCHHRMSRHLRRGFSLVELMIAIVILGLGLVMVATVFPVAWGRARELSEFTQQQSITPAAQNLTSRILRAAPADLGTATVGPSFAGDLLRRGNFLYPQHTHYS